MNKTEFIKKWNVAYEDKEQQNEFAVEMQQDLDAVIAIPSPIRAKAHQLTPNKKWIIWAEDGKYLPIRSSFDHFDIEIRIVEPKT